MIQITKTLATMLGDKLGDAVFEEYPLSDYPNQEPGGQPPPRLETSP